MFQNRSLSLLLFFFAIWVVFINLDSIKEATQSASDSENPVKFYLYAEGERIKDKAKPRQMLTFKVRSSEDLFVGFFSSDVTGAPKLNADIMEIMSGETKPVTLKGRERGVLMPNKTITFGVFYAHSKEEISEVAASKKWDLIPVTQTIDAQ